MSQPRRSTTRASAPTRNVRTRDGATHPRNRLQSAPQSRRDGVSRDGAQPETVATPTFTEVTPRAVKYATAVAFLAWTFAVYDYISFGTLLPKIADSFHWSTSFATAVATWVSVGTFATAMLVVPLLDYLGRLRSVFLCSRAVLPGMLGRGWGRIISIASQLGIKGATGLAHYSAAKAGVIGFTKSLAQEVAERGVLVNAIAPGPIETPSSTG